MTQPPGPDGDLTGQLLRPDLLVGLRAGKGDVTGEPAACRT